MDEISRRILCVDDEPNVLEGLRRQLRGRDLTLAVGPQAGLDALREQGPFALVISDFVMPKMNGAEFLSQVRQLAPDTMTVMLTGCAEVEVAIQALHEGRIFRFLNKPCSREALQSAVRDGLEQHRLIVSQRQLTAALNDANEQLRSLNRELEDRVQERTASITRLHQFVSDMSRLDRLDQVGELVVKTAAEMLDSRRVSLMIPDSSGEYLTILAAVGLSADVIGRIRVPIGAPVAGRAFAEGQSIIVNSPEQARFDERYDSEFFAVVPLASAALVMPGGPVGVLNVTEPANGAPYGENELATLTTIAESAAVAVQNQVRLQERNEARDDVILALAKLAESRDPETGAHLERVQIYCRMLSEVLAERPKYAGQVDDEFISAIFRSSPLHDIGKVGIPDRILLKPGRLTAAEFEIMKTHPTIGGNTIRALIQRRRGGQPFLRMGMDIAYCHHEKYDGSGYPTGLARDQIPLPARILAVADVYDALTSRRVYKPPLSHEAAVPALRAGAGRHFDPDLIEAFFSREGEFRRVAMEWKDEQAEEFMASRCPGEDLAIPLQM